LIRILEAQPVASCDIEAHQIMRAFHQLLHFSDDPKLHELRSRPEVVKGLDKRITSIRSAAAGSALAALSEFAAYVYIYLFNIMSSPDDETIVEAQRALYEAGNRVASHAARERRCKMDDPALEALKKDAERCDEQYKQAVDFHLNRSDEQLKDLLALLADPKEPKKLSRLGELVLSAPRGRGLEPALHLAGRGNCPLWLPSRLLDLAIDMMADEELSPQHVASWLKAALPARGRSVDAVGSKAEVAANLCKSHIAAWELALGDETRRETFAHLCMRLPCEHMDCAVDILDASMLLLRMYFCSQSVASVRCIGETLNLLLKRSVDLAFAILRSEQLLPAADGLLALWCEALHEHVGCPAPTPPQAVRTLSDFPQLLSQLFLYTAHAGTSSTSVWSHVTNLLAIGAKIFDSQVKPAIEWLAASVIQCHSELKRAPVFVDLVARQRSSSASTPRAALSLTETPAWNAMLNAAIPLVPDKWYEEARAAAPAKGGGGGLFLSDTDLTYQRQLQLAHAQLEAQAAAEAEAERLARDEAEKQEAQAGAERQAEATRAWLEQMAKHEADLVAAQKAAEDSAAAITAEHPALSAHLRTTAEAAQAADDDDDNEVRATQEEKEEEEEEEAAEEEEVQEEKEEEEADEEAQEEAQEEEEEEEADEEAQEEAQECLLMPLVCSQLAAPNASSSERISSAHPHTPSLHPCLGSFQPDFGPRAHTPHVPARARNGEEEEEAEEAQEEAQEEEEAEEAEEEAQEEEEEEEAQEEEEEECARLTRCAARDASYGFYSMV